MRDRALEKQWAFLQRSYHPIPGLIGDTYEMLLHLLEQDSTAHPDTLLRVVRGLIDQEGASAYTVHTDGPILLADRGVHLEEAERIASQSFEAVLEVVREDRMFVDTEKEFYRRTRWGRGMVKDALGWVYFKQGRLDSAEIRLERADYRDTPDRVRSYMERNEFDFPSSTGATRTNAASRRCVTKDRILSSVLDRRGVNPRRQARSQWTVLPASALYWSVCCWSSQRRPPGLRWLEPRNHERRALERWPDGSTR